MENFDNENCNIIDDHEEDLQLAENADTEYNNDQESKNLYINKRQLLEKTKIVKQTWSVQEIYQKIKRNNLILSPEYQRNAIWGVDKQSAFIESLMMDILVPPIYVVEIAGKDRLEDSSYEVVDGKQRLTAINNFLKNEYKLQKKYLEYFADLYSDMSFSNITEKNSEHSSALLSFVLDVYVITANSPEFTKYDIFSRLNKGSEKLKVNEIRRAIYRSQVLNSVDEFVKSYLDSNDIEKSKVYKSIFTKNDILRYEDYGRFYRSIAFFTQSKNISTSTPYVDNYNSRPRDMINTVLQKIQNGDIIIEKADLDSVLNYTIEMLKIYKKQSAVKNKIDHVIDACIPFISNKDFYEKIAILINDPSFNKTFEKSAATTSNVNERLKIANKLFEN